MTRFKLMTIASAVAAAFAVPVALAQQGTTPDSSKGVQQRDATGNPSGSPTQPPRATSGDRGMHDPTMRSGSATRGDRALGHSQYESSTVRDVQQALQNKGYDVGSVDGVMGPRTQSALREFQQQQGLPRSGQLDERTMSALDVRASAAGSGSGTMGSTAPSGDRTGAGASGTSAAGGSPAPSAGTSGGTTGAGGTRSDRSSPPTGDRSGTGTSGTSAAGGSPAPSPSGSTGSGTGGRPGG